MAIMLETIIGKRVRILWTNQAGSTPGEFLVKGFYPQLQWVCLHGINETGEMTGNPSWTRLADVDQIEVLDENYNPLASNSVAPANPNVPMTISHEASGVRASLNFDLPQADQDFYAATHAPNAFAALIGIGERLKRDEKNPKRYITTAAATKELHQFFRSVIERAGLNIRY
jgi:hypothetical protein